MDLLEHSLTIRTCPTHGSLSIASNGRHLPCSICGAGTTFVEHVPASQLRGGVEAADEVVAELCALAEEQPGNPHDGLSTRLYAIAHKLERGQGRRP
jgi:hypothetical protein